jgi:hypothetical protein
MTLPAFTVETFQNEYLPAGARAVHAVVTVTATGAAGQGAAPATGGGSAEIIMIDTSGSMGGSKIIEARRAAAAAVDAIRDGVAFGVISGTGTAKQVYPQHNGLAAATPKTRSEAKKAISGLVASDGTAIGSWLRLAHTMFGSHKAALRHAILLTDGLNAESAGTFEQAIRLCEGVFRCDCRGVGADWSVSELRKIAEALLGSLDIVADAAGLAADFESMMLDAMGKEIADVMLRVRVPQHARVRSVKQAAPTTEDLTDRRAAADAQTGEYPTGAWGDESRDYHVCVEVEPGEVNEEMLVARVSVVASSASESRVLGQSLVRAIWTNDEGLSTRIDPRVAAATNQTELADAIQQGLSARRAGDLEAATAKLGRAVALAHASGHEDTARLLAKVVDVQDAATGTIRLRDKVSDLDEMTLDVRSTRALRVTKEEARRPGE